MLLPKSDPMNCSCYLFEFLAFFLTMKRTIILYQCVCKAGYKRLAKQLQTRFMAVSQKKKHAHKNCLPTFRNLYYFLVHLLPHKTIPLCFAKLLLLPWNTRNLFHEITLGNTRYLYTCFASRIFLLWTCFVAFSQVVCSWLKTLRLQSTYWRYWRISMWIEVTLQSAVYTSCNMP